MCTRVKFVSLCFCLVFVLSMTLTHNLSCLSAYEDGLTCGDASGNILQYYTEEKTDIINDFSDTSKKDIRILHADIKNGRLESRPGKEFLIAAKKMPGDEYGLLPYEISFKMAIKSGNAVICLRNSDLFSDIEKPGLRILIENNKAVMYDQTGEFRIEADIPADIGAISDEHLYTLKDGRSHIALYIDDTFIIEASHVYYGETNRLEAPGVSAGTEIKPTGYAAVYSEDFDGYIDDFKYSVSKLTYNPAGQTVDYTYWVSTDDLGRTTPLYSDRSDKADSNASWKQKAEEMLKNNETGSVRDNKYVGVFYFICHVGGQWDVIDHTKLYMELGLDGLKQKLTAMDYTTYGEYWAEPYFGYYRDTDEWVLRKHAQMLSDAGVDFIFVDISNGDTYPDAHSKLFEVWHQIRQEGGSTPQICFLTGDVEGRLIDHLKVLKTTVYSDENMEKYKDLIFMWEGKPLIFGKPGTSLSKSDRELVSKFTVRGCWAWVNEDGYWNWITETPQYKGRDMYGNFEQMAVVMGHHASSSKGRSFTSADGQPNNGLGDYEFSSDTARYGYGFAEQFEYAFSEDPDVLMITGWNEWLAGNYRYGEGGGSFANTTDSIFYFVDEFNPEFSRDGEPMKVRSGVGFGDNYYYQMANYIRMFKGTAEMQKGTGRKTIDIRAGIDQWYDVFPEYTDTAGDTLPRNELSYGEKYTYINNTGRNDIISVKTAQDDGSIYFLVKTAHDIIPGEGENWMNIYIDADQSHSTGWEGYDFVLNRSRNNGMMSVESMNIDGSCSMTGEAEYYISGEYMSVRLPKSAIDTNRKYMSFDFKCTDNSTISANVMEFMDIGDAAPNSRFNFRFIGDSPYISTKELMKVTVLWSGAALGLFGVAVLVRNTVRKRKGRS